MSDIKRLGCILQKVRYPANQLNGPTQHICNRSRVQGSEVQGSPQTRLR